MSAHSVFAFDLLASFVEISELLSFPFPERYWQGFRLEIRPMTRDYRHAHVISTPPLPVCVKHYSRTTSQTPLN